MKPAMPLKLAALDDEDLLVLSAHVQDAVLRAGDLVWSPSRHRFALAMNRFAWETVESGRRHRPYQRRRSAMHFDRVIAVKSVGIDRAAPDRILSLLAVEFTAGDAPAGEIRLLFAGGSEIRLSVECIEAQLADLGAAWQTNARPAHDLAAG
jgi:hypothetical protein